MNNFGRLFKVSIFGESHGECVGICIDGCSAGMPLSIEDFMPDIERRKGGTKGTTPRKEAAGEGREMGCDPICLGPKGA